jgi:hypothetical protein
MGDSMRVERRKLKRSKLQEGVYACTVPNFLRVGAIVDINLEGLAFKYIINEKQPEDLANIVVLELFDRKEKFHLGGIPFRPSYDVPHGGPNSLVSAFMRRVGGRFAGMSNDQRDQLREFIADLAV